MSKQTWFSSDPGKSGGLAVWSDRELIEVHDYNIETYVKLFKKYQDQRPFLVCEKINTVFNGAFASFVLGQFIGEVKGLCEAFEIPFITDKCTPKEWKGPWSDRLLKKKGETWKPNEAKERAVKLCQELYPKVNLFAEVQLKTKVKQELKDGRADAILIGRSFIERGLVNKYL